MIHKSAVWPGKPALESPILVHVVNILSTHDIMQLPIITCKSTTHPHLRQAALGAGDRPQILLRQQEDAQQCIHSVLHTPSSTSALHQPQHQL